MSIRAVFLDLGGVILRTEFQAPRQRLAESLGMDYEDIEKIVFGGGLNGSAARASIGQITEEEHWRNVMLILKRPVSEYERVRDEFFGGDIIDRNLLEFIRSLKPKCKVGLISNAWSGLRAYIERERFEDVFDHMTISAEVGVAKPEAKIFHFALKHLQVGAKEAVFVDDFEANIEACEKVGMKGILFRDAESTIKQLKKMI
jgi:epoxide hydrolase-like predicted phosphatase